MSYLLTCPNCGVREVTDFGYGGEIASRPKSDPTWRELNTYNYFRRNVAGVQREWWFHRSGCRPGKFRSPARCRSPWLPEPTRPPQWRPICRADS